ncbi:methionyl-tRNA synthetase [Babesia ovata]|uniref:methionine--tRNA ligase n=1 Tax=Babesia ovata TaxID=189622 RepID=A0A2H6KE55_9APIC|nr:methionyl-tRNA synthetase [Babesia ovata]GBE61280.1 methionyl-tRNA synthetase [Babesia ovata]
MQLLVLDSSIDSLVAWSAAECVCDSVPTVVLTSISTGSDLYSDKCRNEIHARECLKEVPLVRSKLESQDAESVKLFSEKIGKHTSQPADSVLKQLLKTLNEVPLRPLLFAVDSSAPDVLPIFGCNAVLKYYAESPGRCGDSGCLLHTPKHGQTVFDWFSWSSQLRTLCNKNASVDLKALLSQFDAYLSGQQDSDIKVCIGSVVITLCLLWYESKLEFLGCNLDMFGHIRRYMSAVLSATANLERYRCLHKYYRLHGTCAAPERSIASSDELESLCRDFVGRKFYVTTALAYTNGPPHIGHTYEIVTSDVLVRYFKAFGMKPTLLAGTDEHGLKVATTAESSGMYPIELADYYSAKFRENNAALLTDASLFVRTTERRHHHSAQKIWRILRDRGDIYLGEYSGWYNVREETFLTEVEAAATDYKDPLSGKPYTLMKESSYFFRMSKYQQQLIDKISSDPMYLQPESARNEILSRLKKPLEDLSVSRCNFSWGIPVPDDPSHVMYVWSDALTSYLSGIGFGDFDDISELKLWPPDVQVIGKDIIWFFAVIWTSILMSLDVSLPKTIFAHGFITAADGRKMSKSLGNVVHTKDLLVKYGADSLRYYLVRDSVFGSDVKFDLSSMADLHNADLTDTIGNLVHRITTLCTKFCNGSIPPVADKSSPRPFNMVDVAAKTLKHLQDFALQDALLSVIEAFRDTNKYLTDREPWAKGSVSTRHDTIRNVLEAIYFLNHLMQPVIPQAASVVFKKLNTAPKTHIGLLSADYDNLTEGTNVVVGDILFQKVVAADKTQ